MTLGEAKKEMESEGYPYFVSYVCENPRIKRREIWNNLFVHFRNSPPTREEIENLQDQIKKRYLYTSVTIISFQQVNQLLYKEVKKHENT